AIKGVADRVCIAAIRSIRLYAETHSNSEEEPSAGRFPVRRTQEPPRSASFHTDVRSKIGAAAGLLASACRGGTSVPTGLRFHSNPRVVRSSTARAYKY